ncbi:M14 family metallopeptidase [Algoriphagus zhangzhouensis]|uniref:Zinc carboxypeptidase n=1 Tax=Algoriphagus zhangzhouensis TaxID=1073327 RepID=A0A1M7ZHP9_9BACT|nr:M14 family metallopeptidase [Algoriphagus zhangzhouensis]TDY44230.1 zinc carboxypeptidase [Algoriphagus zhangzhouensis]SHO64418.1 Zinc carboxypeptidase [Algoriphagus zhangzhouensis]
MKKIITLSSFALIAGLSQAQVQPFQKEPLFPENNSKSKFHTVSGERHGPSFFKKEAFPEVEYTPGEKLAFDKYHTVNVMYHWYETWAKQFPEIVDLYIVGESLEGRPIYQMTITNKNTGKETDKPAAYFEGGRHSGEITSSESILWLTQHILENYGKDAEITHLVDTKTIYLRPQNNPDGSNLYLYTAQANRSTVRPHDNDRDGLIDEDPGEDLDGDGILYQIRKKAVTEEDKKKANFIVNPDHPSGKLMKRVEAGKGEYLMYSEGIDNDGDGRYNEDGIGGLDLHRNYLENWRPDTGGDLTGRGYTQNGAGEFPLSEPESKATVLWVLSHPNISVVNSMDTRVPMHLRAPSTSKAEESMYPSDLDIYKEMDELGLSFTAYPWAGDVYETYATRYKVNRMTGDPLKPSPLFGHGPDFGYFYFGSVWYGDELWNNGAMKDYNGDGIYDDYDALMWDEEENGGRGFKSWTPMTHPELGEVEIGGFHPKFFGQNGPTWQLENWAKKQAQFNLAMAKRLPELKVGDAMVKDLGKGEYEISISWENVGGLPVALEQAKLVKIVQEDRVSLNFDKELTEGYEDAKVQILSPELYDKTIYAGYTGKGEKKSATFKLKVNSDQPVKGKIRLSSTRGGFFEKEFTIN